MNFDRKTFFDSVRASLFGGKLNNDQVSGMSLILDEAARRNTPIPWIAYILATTLHETAATMQPIAEYGKGRKKKYGAPDPQTGKIYYGRGYVQLTWKDNYAKAARVLRIDLLANPDLAMVPENAVRIMFQGMEEGWFAGDSKGRHTLARHLNGSKPDYIEARRIINGVDRKVLIASQAERFEAALRSALMTTKPVDQAKPAATVSPPPAVEPVADRNAPEPTNTRPHIVSLALAALAVASLGVALWMLF